MGQFMDVHHGMKGITREQLLEAHRKDQELEGEEGVRFVKAWADPETGNVFCLAEGPNKEAVQRVHKNAGHPADAIYEVKFMVE